ncbi:MAG: LytTR family DNA-binding domain-containing protein [Clostridium sp.]|nr:LytTR family DNA-binding domain-containing protein [Clostridium sp.]
MNIAICDDLEVDRKILIDMINRYFTEHNFLVNMTTYNTGEDLICNFKQQNFDLIFLDIYMAKLNGIDTAKEIRKKDNNSILVFITTSSDFALDAYDLDALQYLIKPITYDKIKKILDKCLKQFATNMRFIKVLEDGYPIKILLNDIYYIDVYDKNCFIHLKDKFIKTYTSLTNLCKLLENSSFLKCHRSYIVNMLHINEMLSNDFILRNGVKIPITRNDKLNLKQTYLDFVFHQMRSNI